MSDHHPSWPVDQKHFCAALHPFGGYKAIATTLATAHLPRPSTQPPGYRTAILTALAQGRDVVEAAKADLVEAGAKEAALQAEARLMGAL